MKKIICFLLGLMLCPNLFAQVYSNKSCYGVIFKDLNFINQ